MSAYMQCSGMRHTLHIVSCAFAFMHNALHKRNNVQCVPYLFQTVDVCAGRYADCHSASVSIQTKGAAT